MNSFIYSFKVFYSASRWNSSEASRLPIAAPNTKNMGLCVIVVRGNGAKITLTPHNQQTNSQPETNVITEMPSRSFSEERRSK